jgi:NADH:ubiquinone oxidoreductase subunit E
MTNGNPNLPRKKRIVLCMGAYCNRGGQAEPLYNILRQRLGELVPAWGSKKPLRWEIANCLSMCGAGPNLVIYPEDAAVNYLDEKQLAAILDEQIEAVEGLS